jgi:hypothetical protein
MVIEGAFLNKWLEYSGGSRPGSNLLKFEDDGAGEVSILIHYVFDWNTRETVDLSFKISMADFQNLLDELSKENYAKLDKDDLNFEWRLSEGRIQFRLEGKNMTPFNGAISYRMPEYADLILDLTDPEMGNNGEPDQI